MKYEIGDLVFDVSGRDKVLYVVTDHNDSNVDFIYVRAFWSNTKGSDTTRALLRQSIRLAKLEDLCALRLELDNVIQRMVKENAVVAKGHWR